MLGLKAFEQWLRGQPGAPKGFLGEFAGGDSTVAGQGDCRSELADLLGEIEGHKNQWLGRTVGGWPPLAKNYHFRLESVGGSGETNLMRFYERYWKG